MRRFFGARPSSRVWLLTLALSVISCVSWAEKTGKPTDPTIQQLLTSSSPPDGVVFEIASGDADALDWALPKVQHYVRALRERFPHMEIAVVTHGREQFALMQEKRDANSDVHQRVQSLVQDNHVPVHVCETYAEHHGVGAEQFPAYVQVAGAGPAQVRAYQELGYTVIRLRKP